MGEQDIDVQGGAARGSGVQAREVEQDGAQEGQRDADRADHDVFPGRFQSRAGPAVSDEEGCRHCRGFDGHPHQADVVGQDCQRHRGQEDGHQDAVEVRASLVGVFVGELRVDVADAGPRGQGAHRADDDEHGDGEGIGAEQMPNTESRAGPDLGAEDGRGHQYRQRCEDGDEGAQSPPADGGSERGRGERSEDRQEKQGVHQSRSSRS